MINKSFKILFTFFLLISCSQQILSQVDRKEIGNLVLENIPDIPQSLIERLTQYQNTRSASFSGWLNNNEGILISTRFGETSQIHKVKNPGGAREQITFYNEPVGNASICPDPNQNMFLFVKDIGGNEFYQLFSYDMSNGSGKMLTDGKSRNSSTNWSNKGDKFVFTSTKRNGRDNDIYLAHINNPDKAEMILEVDGAWSVTDWSPDDSKLLIGNYISVNESYYHIFDLNSKELKQINPSNEQISYGRAVWSKDGNGIFFASDEHSEFDRLSYFDINSESIKVITDHIPWDVGGIELSKQGDKLAFTVNEDGLGKLYLLDTKTLNYEIVKNIPVGQVYGLSFHPDGKKLAMGINTSQTPGDVFVMDLNDNSIERWTYSEVGGLNTEDFVTPKLIHYESFDSVDGKPRMIPAFIYKPRSKGPFPVLIDIHGGPESQARPGFNPFNQYYTNEMSIAVITPNVRGSSGYGKTFLKLDNGNLREESVKDIGSLLDWIKTQPDLDENKVAVTGGSYGGYMVLASMIHFNERLKCGIDIVGISNFVTFLENTQDYRRDLRRVEYGDESDPEMRKFLLEISPTTNAHKITKPLFVVQGLNDPRVPVTEAEQIVEVVRNNGGEVWYLLAKDEGHGFRKKSNRDFYLYSRVLFLEKYLLN